MQLEKQIQYEYKIKCKYKKMILKRSFFKVMNNTVFGKTMGNTRKHSDWKLVITGARRNYLLSEPKYYITNFWCENLLAIEMKKHKYS